jgi:hypothetical protein
MTDYIPVSLEESRKFAENYKPKTCTDHFDGICNAKDGKDINGRAWNG